MNIQHNSHNDKFIGPLIEACQATGTQVILTSKVAFRLVSAGDSYVINDDRSDGWYITLTLEMFTSMDDYINIINHRIRKNEIAILIFHVDSDNLIRTFDMSHHSQPLSEPTDSPFMIRMWVMERAKPSIPSGFPSTSNDSSQVIGFWFDAEGNGKAFAVGYRKASNTVLDGNPQPDEVWQDLYEVIDGKITKTHRRYGQHHPKKTIEDHVVWPLNGEGWHPLTEE